MRIGTMIFEDDTHPGAGWMSFDGDKAVFVEHIGSVPGDALLLTNLLTNDYAPRFQSGDFLGVSGRSAVRFGAELGIPAYKMREGKGKAARDIWQFRDIEKAAADLSLAFCQVMRRVDQLGLSFAKGHVPSSLPTWIAHVMTTLDWRLDHTSMPTKLINRDKLDGGVDYWMKRAIPYRSGMSDAVIRVPQLLWSVMQLTVPVPIPPWKWHKAVAMNDGILAEDAVLSEMPILLEGSMHDIPKEWADWWNPLGTQLDYAGKGNKVRDYFSHPELVFAAQVGASIQPNGVFMAKGYKPFKEVFPKSMDVLEKLSAFSWVDGLIATWIAKILDNPIPDAQFARSPARLWIRSNETLRTAIMAKTLSEGMREAGVMVEVAGFGGGKIHIRHNQSEDEWDDMLAILARTGPFHVMPKIPVHKGGMAV